MSDVQAPPVTLQCDIGIRQEHTAERIACSGVPSRITSVLPAPLHEKTETVKPDQRVAPAVQLTCMMCFLCQGGYVHHPVCAKEYALLKGGRITVRCRQLTEACNST